MASDKTDKTRIEELRDRRMRLAAQRERNEKRTRHGLSVVAKVKTAFRAEIGLDAFAPELPLPVDFARRPNFADCPGLVAAHISESRIREIVACCDAAIGLPSGIVGFDEYEYVGTVRIDSVSLESLLNVAKSLHDSVLFCPDEHKGIILIDHYKVSGVPRDVGFSIVIQGSDLETKLASCFENVIRLGETAR